MNDPHGSARLSADGATLTITTKRKRGKDLVRVYAVKDVRPDPEVAHPAYSLTTEEGEVYHVGANEWGVFCDCPDHHYRRQNDQTPCKHCKSLMAVGLLPKEPELIP